MSKRICYLCGKEYKFCSTCGDDANKPSWYAMWDNERCKDLDDIMVRHTMGKLTTAEAKTAIEEKGLANVEILNENNKKHLKEIMSGVIEKKETVEEKTEEKIEIKAEEVKDIKVENKIEDKETGTDITTSTYETKNTSKMQFKKKK